MLGRMAIDTQTPLHLDREHQSPWSVCSLFRQPFFEWSSYVCTNERQVAPRWGERQGESHFLGSLLI